MEFLMGEKKTPLIKQIFSKSSGQKNTPIRITYRGEKNLGSDLLFRTLVYSTIGDERLDF